VSTNKPAKLKASGGTSRTPEECLCSNHWHDEGDNLGLLNDHHLRAVMNSGHRRGGFIKRAVGKQGTRRYYTFALSGGGRRHAAAPANTALDLKPAGSVLT
jgi:hypothetical protein